MTEFEVKLEIPANRMRAVTRSVLQLEASTIALRAVYFDTAEGDLARHGLVVRARREGAYWYQTAKGPASGPMERLEHTVPMDAPANPASPSVDLTLHDGSVVGDCIRKALDGKGAASAPLVTVFETDILRRFVVVEQGASQIEIALDHGKILSDGRSQGVRELELELKQGSAVDAVALAQDWCRRHGLWLSTISKSAKGRRLAMGEKAGPATEAGPAQYTRASPARDVVGAILSSTLDQVLGNASEIAGGHYGAEHVHQLRVGIRRLRTALRELTALAGDLGSDLEQPLVHAFRELGQQRDLSHVTLGLEPSIVQAGGPVVSTQRMKASFGDPRDVVRAPEFQDALLQLVCLTHSMGEHSRPIADHPRKKLRAQLERLHRDVVKDGKRFVKLDEARQHRVRKRVKRLRYLTEFVLPLFPGPQARSFIGKLKPVQEALGMYNDELMAIEVYRGLAATDPNAWFGAGWLSARQPANAVACAKVLRKFAGVRPFWA